MIVERIHACCLEIMFLKYNKIPELFFFPVNLFSFLREFKILSGNPNNSFKTHFLGFNYKNIKF